MAESYIEDLVQNIYTKCDMSGLDKLNQGLQDAIWYTGELEKNLRDAQRVQKDNFNIHAQAINAQKLGYAQQSSAIRLLGIQERDRIRTKELQMKADMRTADLEENLALRKKRRDDAELRRMKNRNDLWRRGVRLLMTYFGFQTIRNIIDTGARLQMLQKSIQGLTGSGRDWEFITQQAYKFGVSINTVATGYRNFYSSARMAGFGGKQIQGMYGDLLLATRSIGASSEQTGGALLALEQMISKGTVSMEELRRQLGNAIPGAFEIGAKAMNMTTKEFNDFVKSGKLASNVFVPRFIKTLKEQYANGWKDVAQTVAVAQGRLGVAWEKFTMELLHGETGKQLAKAINMLSNFMMSEDFLTLVDVLGRIFRIASQLFILFMKLVRRFFEVLPQILFWLGATGIAGLLVVIYKNISKIVLVIRACRDATIAWNVAMQALGVTGNAGFLSLAKGAGKFLLALLPLFVMVAAIQDVLMWISNKTLGTHFKTLLGAIGDVRKQGKTDTGKDVGTGYAWENLKHSTKFDEYIKKHPQAKQTANYLEQTGQWEKLRNFMLTGTPPKNYYKGNPTGGAASPFARGVMDSDLMPDLYGTVLPNMAKIYTPPAPPQIIPNAGITTGGAASSFGDINKEQQSQTTVTIGDINVYSNASNPAEVAQEVQNQLVSLFLGQGLTMGLEGVTA